MKINESQLADALQKTTSDHPDSKALANLLEPASDAVEREMVLSHVETCAACSAQLQMLMELQPDTEHFVTQSISDTLTTRVKPRWALALSTAAVLLVSISIVFLNIRSGQPPPSVLRGESSEVIPAHQVTLETRPVTLSWQQAFLQPVAVHLMDAAANTLWQSEPIESSQADIPAGVLTKPGTYLWQVESRKGEVLAGPYWFKVE